MSAPIDSFLRLHPEVYARALDARDPRFDGVFFVGITTTRVYCRPVCPARVSYNDRRRFFASAAAAEHAGFRPCLRCRPELAPGRAVIDAISRLASIAAQRIGAGALNGRSVAHLAHELGVTDRHLRRALEREIGVSPVELAQTHRLLLAKQLLADTALSVTRIAYASGFQSLRRFNAAFRAQYRMAPSTVRQGRRPVRPEKSRRAARASAAQSDATGDLVRLTLTYRAPLAWDVLVSCLARDAVPSVERVDGRRYGRTVSLHGQRGVLFVEDVAPRTGKPASRHVTVHVSASLVPVLMPLLARLRQMLDLDAEPTMVDGCLIQGGLGALVARRPGLRIPGALDGFDVALRTLMRGTGRTGQTSSDAAQEVASQLGEPIDTGVPTLSRLMPSAGRVAEAGAARLRAMGVAKRSAEAAVAVARLVEGGSLRLEPGSDPSATHQALVESGGVTDTMATTIVMRALYWPDAFPAGDRRLQRAAKVTSSQALLARAEQWRPWRAYAAMHLWLCDEER